MTTQIILRLSDEIANRLRAVVPARQRNKFVTAIVERELLVQENGLANIAKLVTKDELNNPELLAEMQAWENATIGDGYFSSEKLE